MSEPSCLFTLRVRKDPTALERIGNLLRRRGHELLSLSMGPSEATDIDRFTVEVRPRSGTGERVVQELSKMVAILEVSEIVPSCRTRREVSIVRLVKPATERRAELDALLESSGARCLEESEGELVVELSNTPDRLREHLGRLGAFGVAGAAHATLALARP